MIQKLFIFRVRFLSNISEEAPDSYKFSGECDKSGITLQGHILKIKAQGRLHWTNLKTYALKHSPNS